MGRTFWAIFLVFISAIILLISSPVLGEIDMDKLWWGVLAAFSCYSGFSGLATVMTTKKMPKDVMYTAPYVKMVVIVIFTWVLFFTSLIMQLVHKENYSVFLGFTVCCAMTGVFSGVKKGNIAIDKRKG